MGSRFDILFVKHASVQPYPVSVSRGVFIFTMPRISVKISRASCFFGSSISITSSFVVHSQTSNVSYIVWPSFPVCTEASVSIKSSTVAERVIF